MSAERVQKLLARSGLTSRRKAEELVREGRVTINGRVAEIGDKADLAVDSVKVDGKRLRPLAQHRYLLLNKPKGYLTAVSDEKGRPTVLDLVPPGMRNALFPVGRLDFQTEGLLLLTTDGEFAERVAHPRHGCSKVYEVKVQGLPAEPEIDRLRRGVVLEGKRTAPARIVALGRTGRGEEEGNSWWEVQLQEGRTRQIREMFFRIGYRVQKLRRVAIGPVRDPAIPLGALRDLDEREIDLLKRAADPALTPARRPAPSRPRTRQGAKKGAPTAPARRPPAGTGKRRPSAERPETRGPETGASRKRPPTPRRRDGPRRGGPAPERPETRGPETGAGRKRLPAPRRGDGPRRGSPSAERPETGASRKRPPTPRRGDGPRRGGPAPERPETRGPETGAGRKRLPAPRRGDGPRRSGPASDRHTPPRGSGGSSPRRPGRPRRP